MSIEDIKDRIINLTPHSIFLNTVKDGVIEFKPSGMVARINTTTWKLDKYIVSDSSFNRYLCDSGIDFICTEFEDPIGLPLESKDCLYIVSSVVKSACVDRNDLVVPSELIRDNEGRVVGCKSFSF